MVGWLVEQHDVGRGRQHPRQRRAARFAAREPRRLLITMQPELLQHEARLVVVVARSETGLDISKRRRAIAEIRLLRQIADSGAGLDKAAAAIGLHQAGGDLEERRLAGTVAADQTDALFRRDRELDA